MRKFALTVAFTLATAASVRAQDVAYEKKTFDNGLTVILHEDHTLPVVAVNLWYRVGSKDEPLRRSGFAHLFEHLMFMGTKRAPTGTFDTLMSAGGGSNNASTSEDRTNYHEHGPAELLPTLLWLEADRLEGLGADMTLEKLDKQRDIVRNERRQTHENRPYGKSDLVLQGLLFPEGHPYHIPVIGTHEDLEAATVQDVKDFFATYYVPNNCSLVICGDFDPVKTKELVAKLFGTLPRGNEPAHKRASPVALPGVIRATCVDKVQLPRTTIAYHSPARYAPGDAEMSLAGQILSQGKTSRLYKRLVIDEKLCTAVSARQDSMQLGSVFQIEATARPGEDLSKIEKIVDEELAKFVADGPSQDELARRQEELELGAVTRLQSLERIADKLNEYECYLGNPGSFRFDLARYRDATPASVRERAAQVLTPNARVVVRVLPEQGREGPSPRDERPAKEERRPFQAQAPETAKLSNGIELVVFNRPALPLVQTTLLWKTPILVDAEGKKAGLPSLTAAMLREGAGELDALAFDEALQKLGARLQSSAGHEHAALSLAVLRHNFEKATALAAQAARNPRFDEKDFARVKRLHADQIRRRDDQPTNVAGNVARSSLYGPKNPFAWPSEGTTTTLRPLTLEDVKAEYGVIYTPRHMTILVAGDVTLADARATFEKLFGDWKAAEVAAPPALDLAFAPADKLRVLLVDRPDAVQTVIRFEAPGFKYAEKNRVPLRMLNAVFGGGFSSRLNQNLREQHGYTYGASSRFGFEPSTGTFVASSSVKAEVTGASLKEFLGEITRIRKGDSITDAETSRARETLRAEHIHATGDLAGIVGIASELAQNGLALDAWASDLAKLDEVRTADLNALAHDSIALERGVLVLVGDKKSILEQLKGLDLPAPVEVEVAREARGPRGARRGDPEDGGDRPSK
jgi:predicted Zn-dependent peptidase